MIKNVELWWKTTIFNYDVKFNRTYIEPYNIARMLLVKIKSFMKIGHSRKSYNIIFIIFPISKGNIYWTFQSYTKFIEIFMFHCIYNVLLILM